jgi:hypothetical protein
MAQMARIAPNRPEAGQSGIENQTLKIVIKKSLSAGNNYGSSSVHDGDVTVP